MLRKLSLLTLLFLFTISLSAQDWKPKNADAILKAALKEAKAENKNLMVIFHASWCGWCKRLDKAMQSNELKKTFESNWVITHIDVLERKGKIDSLENPGGQELMKKFGGEKAGLPFCAFLDKNGKKIANSMVMPDKSNIGYPGAPEEIELFGKLLKKTSKKITDKQLAEISDYFTKNAPKPDAH